MRMVEDEAAVAKKSQRVGEFITSLAYGGGLGTLDGGELVSWKVRMPTEEDPGALLIVQAKALTGEWVSFVGAYRVDDAILAWRKRSLAGRMKWRESVPWEGGGSEE